MSAKNRLVLIDGKSIFYRGYYAMPGLTTRAGQPTGAIYGFAAISMTLVRELRPTKVIVAWDSKTSAESRRELYPNYKVGRTKPGDDFYAQIPPLKKLVETLGWAFCECDRFEADDIIGTLSLQADNDLDDNGICKWETFIISSDLDMLQIVDANTRMYRVISGFSKLEELDVPAVEAKYHIKKSQFLDLKALKGDASDRIPGVPGIGEKTAVKLLNDFDTLENIYAHLDKISESVKTKLEAGKDSAFLSKKLAKIQFDAPVSLADAPDLTIDGAKILAELKSLEFYSLIKKFGAELAKSTSSAQKTLFTDNFSAETAQKSTESQPPAGENLQNSAKTALGEFPETSLSPQETTDSPTAFTPNSAKSADELNAENAVSLQKTGTVSSQNAPNSAKTSASPLLNPENSPADSAVSRTDSEFLDLKTATKIVKSLGGNLIIAPDVKTLMHKNAEITEEIRQGAPFWDLAQADFLLNPLRTSRFSPKNADIFSADDFKIACAEQKLEFEKLPKLYQIYTEFDLPLIPILYQMEKTGMKIDRAHFARLKTELEAEAETLRAEVIELAGVGFNPNSPKQLGEVLFSKLSLPTAGIKRKKTGFSTGVAELKKLENRHPIIPKILEYREIAKLLSTYVAPLPELADENSRVHTTFTQNITATGRLSSLNPNLQNIPVRTNEGKKIRTGFVAEQGKKLVSADYSQFELRLVAALASDQNLIADFNAGVDIHTKTAAEVFNIPMGKVTKKQRRAAKVINFGILYGMSAKGLADATGMAVGEAKVFIENYFNLRAPVREFLDQILTQARTAGFVETFYGRRKPTPDVKSPVFQVRSAAERAAQNMPIQGTEADLMKRAMQKVAKKLPRGAELVMQVHDSLIVECAESQVKTVARVLKDEMGAVAPELNISLAVEVTTGDNWGEL